MLSYRSIFPNGKISNLSELNVELDKTIIDSKFKKVNFVYAELFFCAAKFSNGCRSSVPPDLPCLTARPSCAHGSLCLVQRCLRFPTTTVIEVFVVSLQTRSRTVTALGLLGFADNLLWAYLPICSYSSAPREWPFGLLVRFPWICVLRVCFCLCWCAKMQVYVCIYVGTYSNPHADDCAVRPRKSSCCSL